MPWLRMMKHYRSVVWMAFSILLGWNPPSATCSKWLRTGPG